MGNVIDVVKRGGKRPTERFDRDKLHASVYAACRSVRSLDGSVDTARKVCDLVIIWTDNKSEITSADIRRQAAKALSRPITPMPHIFTNTTKSSYEETTQMAKKHNFDYDLIVIGSGAGGSAAATIAVLAREKQQLSNQTTRLAVILQLSDVPTKSPSVGAAQLYYDEARRGARFGLRSATSATTTQACLPGKISQ